MSVISSDASTQAQECRHHPPSHFREKETEDQTGEVNYFMLPSQHMTELGLKLLC